MADIPISLQSSNEVSIRRIVRIWWPLAASWLLMGAELPVLSAVVARLPDPEINLAAYGGVVFPLALIIEAPIIMLLAASTALSKDLASWRIVHKYMMVAGASLTLLHILVAFTPLYYVVVEDILGVPSEVVEPARIGLMIMTPWTWSIAYRRFNQGGLIRFGHSRAVGVGTVVRLSADSLVLAIGYLIGSIPGIVVATSAVATGVVGEALYSKFAVQPVVEHKLKPAPPVQPPLTWRAFWAFYIPLAMTSLILLLANPLGSAALSRMPLALSSLATWSVLNGLVFMVRNLGVAYNEVVVALLEEPFSSRNLKRFALLLAGGATVGLLLLAVTPLADLWFKYISALPDHLMVLALSGLWLALPQPALSVAQSWFQGTILFSRRTRAITESVIIYLLTSAAIMVSGVAANSIPGLYVGVASITISALAQTTWLWYRSRTVRQQVALRDALPGLGSDAP